MNRYEEEITCLNQALALNLRYADAWYSMGATLLDGSQCYQEASECFKKAQQLEHPQATNAISVCQRKLE